jgi:hypothetical protein
MAVVMTDQPSAETAISWATLRTFVLIPVAAFVLGCMFWMIVGRFFTSGSSSQLPTAAEVFALRSKCADLINDLRNARYPPPVGLPPTLDVTFKSHYNPSANRCYVLETEQGYVAPSGYTKRTLYDGQTKEVLAYTHLDADMRVRGAMRAGHLEVKADVVGATPYDQADAFIKKVMEDDRTP